MSAINERVSPERLDTISAEYSRPNHAKNFSATDWEIAAMARELKELRNNNESLRGEVLIAHRTLMNQWAQLQQYRAAAEPVVYIGKQMLESLCDEGGRICGRVWRSNTDELSGESRIPLYASPQVTSVPDDAFERALLVLNDTLDDCGDSERGLLLALDRMGIEVAGAAPAEQAEQLSGNTEQVSQPVLPATQFKPVADLYGIAVPGGRSTSYSTDAAEASDCRVMGWDVQEFVKLERLQEAITGNSPAIPDGYALVPVKPTQAMIDAHVEGVQSGGIQKGYRAMLAAAPQQEANNG